MPELRKDPVIGRWVIIATERGKRPGDFSPRQEGGDGQSCPFCEGSEGKTPSEIYALRNPGSGVDGRGWQLRVVPNKFPALRMEGVLNKEGVGMYDMMSGLGAHEIIIETPSHMKRMDELDLEQISHVLDAYKIRMESLMGDDRIRYAIVFKNEGDSAGSTLSHSHSQIIATPVTPKRVKEELEGSREYYQYKDRCVYCDIIREELKQKIRLVYENKDFISFCPFASRFPFEMCILPKRHHPDYHAMQASETPALAEMLKVTLGKLAKALSRPQYNYIIHTGPVRKQRKGFWTTIDQDYHWHIEIMPRLTKVAGFEWGTGFYINPTIPEEAAKFLQGTGV